MTHLGDELLLTWEAFDAVKQPHLDANDLLIFLEGTIESDAAQLAAIKTRATAARASGSKGECAANSMPIRDETEALARTDLC